MKLLNVFVLCLLYTVTAKETLVSIQAYSVPEDENRCKMIIMAQGVGTDWGTLPGQYMQVGVWNQESANTLSIGDTGIQCEIVYTNSAPDFTDISLDNFNSQAATVICQLHKVIADDLTTEARGDPFEAKVFDITDKTFTISVEFDTEIFEYVATEISGATIDLNKEIGLLTAISDYESPVSAISTIGDAQEFAYLRTTCLYNFSKAMSISVLTLLVSFI